MATDEQEIIVESSTTVKKITEIEEDAQSIMSTGTPSSSLDLSESAMCSPREMEAVNSPFLLNSLTETHVNEEVKEEVISSDEIVIDVSVASTVDPVIEEIVEEQNAAAVAAEEIQRQEIVEEQNAAAAEEIQRQEIVEEQNAAAAEEIQRQLPEITKEDEEVIGLDADTQELYELGIKKTVEFPEDWAIGHESDVAKTVYKFNPGDSHIWVHAVFQCKDVTIDEVVAGTGELEEWPQWHPTVWRTEFIGPRTATSVGNRVDNSVALGLVKFDANTKLKRFIGKGYVLEVLVDAQEGDAAYVPPIKGLKRGAIESYVMYVPTPVGVMFIQHAKVELPMALPSWIIKMVMTSLSPKMMSNFQNLMNLVKSDKHNFKELMKKDETGVYALLKKTQVDAEKDYLVKNCGNRSNLTKTFAKYISPGTSS